MIFSSRKRLADSAVQWCEANKAPLHPENIVAALDASGALLEREFVLAAKKVIEKHDGGWLSVEPGDSVAIERLRAAVRERDFKVAGSTIVPDEFTPEVMKAAAEEGILKQ